MSFLFDREGHLLDLGIDSLLAEELSAEELAEVNAHSASCEDCAARLSAARGVLEVEVPPPPWRREPVQPANQPWRWALLVPALAAAAALAFVVLPDDPDPEYRVRGSAFHLEVYKKGAEASQLLVDGDAVEPGDALGFRVALDAQRHVAVIGADDRSVFPIWPEEGGSRALDEGEVALSSALVLDDTPGTERVVGVACEQPFGLHADEVRALVDGAEREGCSVEILRLDKSGR